MAGTTDRSDLGHAVLILLTSRPAQFQELSGLLNMTHLSLNRLDRQGGLAMVEEIAGAGVVPDDVRNAIVDRGDGIPLFIEELTKSVLEMRIGTPADEPPRSFADALDLVIPATLQDLIMARLDRLDIDKEVLQVAACIGRQFSHALLAVTVEVPHAALNSALEQLVANGTVFARGTPPESDYLFRHALIRDAIYVNLLRREREQIHRRIATVLDRASQLSITPERASLARNAPVEGDAGQIAYHYREAGIWDKALRFFVIKGRKAYAEYANLEAAEAFASALSALEKMGVSKENEQATIEISILLGSIRTFLGDLGRGLELYSSALKKAEGLQDRRLLVHSHAKIGRAYYDIGEFERCDESYSKALELAETDNDQVRIASVLNHLGLLRLTTSTLPDAIHLFEKSLELQTILENRAGEASTCISRAGVEPGGKLRACRVLCQEIARVFPEER